MRTEVFKDTRLLDALEFIDDAYIASAAGYKMKYTEQPHEHKMTWRTPLKHWKQFVALAASLILLSAAFPTIVRFVSTTIDFLAGRGGGTTSNESTYEHMDSSDVYFDTSDTENNVTNEISDSETTIIKEEIPDAEPDYWRFISELEPITEEEMLTIRNLWVDLLYNEYFDNSYKLLISQGYSETEASRLADESALKSLSETKDNFFHYWYFQQRGYLGRFADYVILWRRGGGAMSGTTEMIGGFDIGFDKYYAYKDGKLYSLQEIYANGQVNDDDIATILNRRQLYIQSLLNYWPDQYQKQNNN